MSKTTMYEGIPFSPDTTLTKAIGGSDTTIYLTDASVLPDAPNYATLIENEKYETIKYDNKTGNTLTAVTRAVEGDAHEFTVQATIARYYNNIDLISTINNIDDLYTTKADKTAIPIVPTWALAEDKPTYTHTEVGADALGSADNALQSAKTYTDSEIKSLESELSEVSDNTINALYYTSILDTKMLNKVDKKTGKGLSTNDYTTEEKNKLAGVESGANATAIADDLQTASVTIALSANQGKVLNERIGDINTALDLLNGEVV